MKEKQSSSRTDWLLVGMLTASLVANVLLVLKVRSPNEARLGQRAMQLGANLTAREMAEIGAGSAPSKGSSNAPVTLVVFSDFQCPFCRQFASTLRDVELQEGNNLRVVMRALPLPIHPGAKDDAELAACVARQNSTEFWELYDFFYSGPVSAKHTINDALSFLRSRGVVDTDQLNACFENRRADDQVTNDIRLARKYGVRATPTSFVNGVRVIGGFESSGDLVRLIEDQAKSTVVQ